MRRELGTVYPGRGERTYDVVWMHGAAVPCVDILQVPCQRLDEGDFVPHSCRSLAGVLPPDTLLEEGRGEMRKEMEDNPAIPLDDMNLPNLSISSRLRGIRRFSAQIASLANFLPCLWTT